MTCRLQIIPVVYQEEKCFTIPVLSKSHSGIMGLEEGELLFTVVRIRDSDQGIIRFYTLNIARDILRLHHLLQCCHGPVPSSI